VLFRSLDYRDVLTDHLNAPPSDKARLTVQTICPHSDTNKKGLQVSTCNPS
jgi:hypothetical protein